MAGQSRSRRDRPRDIVVWGEKLASYASAPTLEAFSIDQKAVDASTKCIEVIGEAAKHILAAAPERRDRYPTLKLTQAYLTRNRLSYGYFDIDPKRVWDTARNAVPELVHLVKQIPDEEYPKDDDVR